MATSLIISAFILSPPPLLPVPLLLRLLLSPSLPPCRAFQGLSINEFDGLEFEVARPTDLPSGQQVLERLSFDQSTVSGSIAKESQILVLWYWAASALLRAKQPVFAKVEEVEDREEKQEGGEEVKVVLTEEAVVV